MTRDELIEQLADIEHQRWGDWHQWQDTKGFSDPYDVAFCFDGDEWTRWNSLADTPYADLPEHSKQSDRDQVMRYLPLIIDFVAEWIEDQEENLWLDALARRWREAMSSPPPDPPGRTQ